MNMNYKFWILGVLALVVMNGAFSDVLAASKDTLSLNIATEKDRYVIGEPIYLRLRIKNISEVSTKLTRIPVPKYGSVRVQILKDEKIIKYMPLTLLLYEARNFELMPQQTVSVQFPIFFGKAGWVFRDEGDYSIRIKFTDNSTFISNSLKLRLERSKVSGILVNKSEASLEAGKFLLWHGGDHLTAGLSLLKTITKEYPDSVLAYYARANFGISMSKEFKNYKSGTLRAPNHPEAIKHLILQGSFPSTNYISMKTAISLAAIMKAEGNDEGYQQQLGIIKNYIPDDSLISLANVVSKIDRLMKQAVPK